MYRFVLLSFLLAMSALVHADSDRSWSRVINRVTDSIVTIRVDAARAFDTAVNSSSQATGFVVDAERGIILTNRHVVQPGPVVAEALFANREEIELIPVYRDPVHDFGFFQYNPKDLKFIKPESLVIKPEAAKVGSEIRVVGNDAGEQLSILAGTLARIDRKAPYYGRGRYNDFNTFYYQSASGVSGGSSGSPVIDINGHVIALNAGGSLKAASSFFLPLHRVKRALELIQKNTDISRGTLQTTFDYKPYDELRRLGLSQEMEAQLRRVNNGDGMLVVRRSLPKSTIHKSKQSTDNTQILLPGLLPGDIVIKGGVAGKSMEWIRRYDEMEALLDSQVGKEIQLVVERNGHPVNVKLTVDNLHQLTPDKYLTFGQAIVHNLSYQQARHLNRPVEGVYVAQAGYLLSSAGVPRGAVILSVNKQPVNTIDDLEVVLDQLSDRQQASIKYITFKETQRTHVSIMRMDRRWFPLEKCYRDDRSGKWPCEALKTNNKSEVIDKANVKFIEYKDSRANRLSPSIVSVEFDVPYHINGVQEAHYAGAGLIIDKQDGLVLVDRNTVPISLGDVRVIFAGALDVPAKVVFVHPLHNLAIVKYDPQVLGDTEIEEVTLKHTKLEVGDDVWLVALKDGQELLVEETRVSAIDSLDFSMPQVPSFRESNLDVISLHNPPSSRGGVLTDDRGRVLAVWSSFAYGEGKNLKQFEWGVPAEIIEELLEQWHCCKQFNIRSLDVQLAVLSIAQARKLGLTNEWTDRFQDTDAKRQVLAVSRRVAGSDAANKLKEGDLILAIDGEMVRSYRDVEKRVQKDQVNVTVNRLGQQLDIKVNTRALDSYGTKHVLQWSGALIQQPHRELSLQRGIEPKGVYVSYVFHGSPADRSRLSALLRIVEVNGEAVEDLLEFKKIIGRFSSEKFIQLKVLDLLNRESVISVKQNHYYWPTREIYQDSGEWFSNTHKS